ncbi:hypothetical protein Ahy_B07g086587 [Arachis hypogaea]|uniref:Protein FAR1-RELATED SEQUENCE n=1 Tax=Arachis hypogaea TaxID=3818 RepID=A0A444YA39_ARAHY|nr:hypothetical protein Ahy_B07g086587 [Arachis hypogaea]
MGTAPQCIITDQCQSIYLTFQAWGYRRYGTLYGDLNDIVWNSRTEESFEEKWADFIDEYNLHDNTWLSVYIWMFNISVIVDGHFSRVVICLVLAFYA